MTFNMVLAAFCSFIISLVSIPVIIKLSHKYEIFDYACSRKIHTGNIPRLGGLGIFLGCFPLTCIYLCSFNTGFNNIFLISGMLIAFLLGFIDDLVPMRARYKLLLQILAALMAAYSGLLIKDFRFYTFFNIEFGYWAYPATVLWIITFMNAVNLIDGMDGLSTGIVLIANLFIIIISYITGSSHVLALSLILECSIAGFYIFNFPPAKIFLGDGGAYFIGFMYAVLPLMGVKKTAALTVFLVPMILMLVPLADVFQVMLNRLKNGHNIFHPDKRHLHHRLMNLGFSIRGILAVVYSYTLILGIFSLIIVRESAGMTMILFGSILMIFGISILMLRRTESVIADLKEHNVSEEKLITFESTGNIIFLKSKTG